MIQYTLELQLVRVICSREENDETKAYESTCHTWRVHIGSAWLGADQNFLCEAVVLFIYLVFVYMFVCLRTLRPLIESMEYRD